MTNALPLGCGLCPPVLNCIAGACRCMAQVAADSARHQATTQGTGLKPASALCRLWLPACRQPWTGTIAAPIAAAHPHRQAHDHRAPDSTPVSCPRLPLPRPVPALPCFRNSGGPRGTSQYCSQSTNFCPQHACTRSTASWQESRSQACCPAPPVQASSAAAQPRGAPERRCVPAPHPVLRAAACPSYDALCRSAL